MWFRSALDVLSSRITPQSRRRPIKRRLKLQPLEERRLLTLNPAVNYNVGASPLDVVAGDFNGDGKTDLATINASHLSLVLGNGDGTFQAPQHTSAGSGMRNVAAGHFNGDSLLDLAITSNTSVTLLLGNGVDGSGNVTFQVARTFSTGTNTSPGAIAVGDLNGDGKLDVAAGQSGGTNVTVLLGSGDGNLKAPGHFAVGGSDPTSIAVGDLNGDGKLDLATSNRWSSNVSVLINNGNDAGGNATFQPARNTALNGPGEGVAVGDFNADGKLDLVATSSFTYWGYYYSRVNGYVNVLLGNGDGSFAPVRTTWANNTQLGEIATADFNADGKLDVVTPDGFVQPTNVDPTVLLGKGDGYFDAPYHFDGGYGPIGIVAIDLNADTAADVGVANLFSHNVSVFLNNRDWPPLGAPFVSVGDVYLTEGNTGTTNAVFTVSLSAAFNQPISINYSTVDGTATAGSDYQAIAGVLSFNSGETRKTLTVLINGDRLAESSEHFLVNLSNPSNVRIADGQGFGSIADNEPLVTVSSAQVTEGNTGTTNAVFTVTLATASSGAVIVNWSTADGNAIAGSDYQAVSGTLTFNPGASLTQSVSVPVLGDRVGEYYSEYFSVRLSNGYSASGTIVDDEPLISISDANVTEGHTGTTAAVFTVTLSRTYDQNVTVNFSTAEGDTEAWYGWSYYGYYPPPPAATSGSDFQAASGTLTFAPGQTSKTISVLVNGDRMAEPYNEYFSVNLSAVSVNASSSDAHGVGIITDDEPSVSIDPGTGVTEGNSGTTTGVFTARLSAAATAPVTVTWSTADLAAVSGSDYQSASGTLTFAPGALTQTIPVTVLGDRVAEYSEYFYINLGNGTSQYGYILDDEPRISIGDASVTEGNSGTKTAVFTVSLWQAYDQAVTVNFSTAEGDTEAWYGWGYYGYYAPPPAATAGSDFQAASGSLSFAAGETRKTISVVINGDSLVEENEYFSVNLSGASANAGFNDAHAVGVIVDDEPRVSINSVSVTEGNSGTTNAVFTVTLSAASDQPVTVVYTTTNGGAMAGTDFDAASGTLTFAPGQTSRTVSVAVKGDTRDEYDEYFYVNLTASSGALITGNYGVGTIVDNDPAPSMRISDASVTEGNSGTKLMTFTVTLSAASDKSVWVDYKTSNGSAKTSDKDYVAASGTLYFAPGETAKTISVEIKGDRKKESNEYFHLKLFNVYEAVFADAEALGNILNDD